ncbi:hypothetical protein Tco_0887294 [Tanacetum coccineum]
MIPFPPHNIIVKRELLNPPLEDSIVGAFNTSSLLLPVVFVPACWDWKPKEITEALEEESCVESMQEEYYCNSRFNSMDSCTICLMKKEIGTQMGLQNKKDERGFAPVARLKPLGSFMALMLSYMGFKVYINGYESAFLVCTDLMRMYVSQPQGFVDPKYLKGKPKLGLWYPRVSSFDLEAYSDSDYAGANLDRKSTTGGCQFLGRRLISWQCKKQTIVATSTTKAEYVAAANCCGQVLWIQNQMLDYGFNFMNIKIYIDNESTICIVKNPVFHSKTKHIEIRHHFIRDAYEKKLIQVLKIHTDDNVADLLTKAFDVSRHQELASLEKMTSALAISGQTTTGKESSNPLMADSLPKTIQSNDPPLLRGYTLGSGQDSLKLMKLIEFFCDKHNMVAYLEKPEGSAEFHQIIDFLTASHIHYALIENPTIYASFIKQFWTTTTASTNVNGEVELTASIDGQAVTSENFWILR